MKNNIVTAQAIGKRIKMSPKKVRRVLRLIKDKSYQDALLILKFLPYKACNPIWKVLRSAIANLGYKCNINKENIRIKEVFVNQGPVIKRFRPRSQGRTFIIRKFFCHITVIVDSINKL
jgi:large subunit ribosomal protein L22